MALELKLIKTGISSLTDRIFLQDTTGVFESENNPGGYGAPNPERNELAIVLTGQQKRTTGDTRVVFSAYDPLVVTDFEAFTPADGWYLINMYGLQLLQQNTATQLFQVDEIVYDSSTPEPVRILTAVEESPSDWIYTYTPATEDDLDNSLYLKPHIAILNTWTLGKLCIIHSKLLKRFWADPTNESFKDEYFIFDALLTSIQYAFGFSNYTNAQEQVELAEGYQDCVEDITCELAENIA